ncbi:putative sugar phosphate/phosphate translocator [Vitis vinifera]|uniref:Putative sugar phosphate/phosphate translocator n=1 Tax=Vitis vinifera TaxID=29760 RepID=A0A438JAE4_VITVI|nr:putative sugar phosphate/phosphate translocator [Vitis vinifera]
MSTMALFLSICGYSINYYSKGSDRNDGSNIALFCFKTLLYLLLLVCQAGCKFSQCKELSVELCFTEWNARKLGKLHVYKTKFVEEIDEGEPSFHMFGFIICISATAARAFKSVLQGKLLTSEGEKLNSMNLLLYMAPIAVAFLIPATLIMEENVVAITLALARDDIKIIWYLLFNSALAYFVNLTNFLVTKHTSALTLQVLGNAKGAVAVVISILIFRNPVSVTGMLGYMLTVIGVVLYSESKKRNK